MTRPSILATTVAALLVASCGGNDNTTEPAGSAPVSTIAITSRNHVDQDIDYPQSPPIGGDHNPVWQNCGVYRDPVLDEMAVHSLEHGAVWITYRPRSRRHRPTRDAHERADPHPAQPIPGSAVPDRRQRMGRATALRNRR